MILLCLLFSFFFGCASYRPIQIGNTISVQRDEVIKIKANQIHHPLLKPVNLNIKDGISPDEAAIIAVVMNPILKAERDKKDIADAQVIQAGLLPNPELSLSLEKPVGGRTGDKMTGFGAGIDWKISPLITRNANINSALLNKHSIDLEIAWKEWQVAEAAKLQVYRLFIAKRLLSFMRKRKYIADRLYQASKRAVYIGIETTSDLIGVEKILHDANEGYIKAQSDVRIGRLRLNKILGLPVRRNIRLQKDIRIPSALNISLKELLNGLEKRRLDLLALRYGYKSQEERLRAAIRSQFPKIGLGFEGGRDTDGAYTIGFGINISLPVFNRNQGRIAIERAKRKELFDEYKARFFEARSDIVRIYKEISFSIRQKRYLDESIHRLERILKAYHREMSSGQVSILEYYRMLLEINSRKIQRLRIQARLAELFVGLELASGRYIEGEENKYKTRYTGKTTSFHLRYH